jgi:hypothetical protein
MWPRGTSKEDTKEEEEEDSTSSPSLLPCVSDYVHIRPREDAAVMERMQHVDVPAGAAVFWDQRIPHSNSYHNQSGYPREVVYGGFLPRGIKINDNYAKEQLRRFMADEHQPDFWSKKSTERMKKIVDIETSDEETNHSLFDSLSERAKRLLR